MEEDREAQDVAFPETESIREIQKPFTSDTNHVTFQDTKVKQMEEENRKLREALDTKDKKIDEILQLLRAGQPQNNQYDRRSYSPGRQDNRYDNQRPYSPGRQDSRYYDYRSFLPVRQDNDSRYPRSPSRDQYDQRSRYERNEG